MPIKPFKFQSGTPKAEISKFRKDIEKNIIPQLEKLYGVNFSEPRVQRTILTYPAQRDGYGRIQVQFSSNNANTNKGEVFTTVYDNGTYGGDDVGNINPNNPNDAITRISDVFAGMDVLSDKELEQKRQEKAAKEQQEAEARQKEQEKLNKLKQASSKQEDKPSDDKQTQEQVQVDTDAIGNKIVEILGNYGVNVEYEEATVGPAITQYEFKPQAGTRISEVQGLSREIAMGLAVRNVSIEPVEGKTYIGIQVPNSAVATVSLDELLQGREKKGVSIALGKDLNGEPVVPDILKMQHILIGGATGSGKSVAINTIIASLIQQYSPDEVKLILIDPKKVELAPFKSLPHLAMPIVTEPEEADRVLKDMVQVMNDRYKKFADIGVKNIQGYNQVIKNYNQENPDSPEEIMPYIIIIIDELADLMMTAGKSVEQSIQRLTQLSRAAGIHLIVATQRPSVDVVTGPIKANIPSRIAFSTASGVDSRTILDQQGAEKLLGKGDMLFKPIGAANSKRVQGAFVPDEQINQIVQDAIDKYSK